MAAYELVGRATHDGQLHRGMLIASLGRLVVPMNAFFLLVYESLVSPATVMVKFVRQEVVSSICMGVV